MNTSTLAILTFLFLLASCTSPEKKEKPSPTNTLQQMESAILPDSVESGTTYLPVYSQIYQRTERLTFDLTITVSIRNLNEDQSVYLNKIDYFDTKGELIKEYLDRTIDLEPYETIEVVIEGANIAGGTGDNFVVDWSAPHDAHPPLLQGVMISTAGQQGISFVTNGIRVE